MLRLLLALGLVVDPAAAADRPYQGPVDLIWPSVSAPGPRPRPVDPPAVTHEEHVFIDPDAPLDASSRAAAPGSLRTQTSAPIDDPLALLEAGPHRDGTGWLVTAGIFGGLSVLSALVVTVVSHSHVACLRDQSALALVPCSEQVDAHRTAVGLSTALLVAGLPFLVTGTVLRGRFLAREGARTLAGHQIIRRNVGASLAVAGGVGVLATSIGLVAPVLLGSCGDGCAARSISSQVLWWAGAGALAVGTGLLGLTRGKTQGFRGPRLRIAPSAFRRGAGLSLGGRF